MKGILRTGVSSSLSKVELHRSSVLGMARHRYQGSQEGIIICLCYYDDKSLFSVTLRSLLKIKTSLSEKIRGTLDLLLLLQNNTFQLFQSLQYS